MIKFLQFLHHIVFDFVKNFMKRRFIFENQMTSNTDTILKFAHLLLFYSNHQSIIHSRFHHLIQKLNLNNKDTGEQKSNNTGSSSSVSSSQSAGGDEVKELLKRKSYLMPNDLQDDLVECKCDSYMQVKSGYAEVIPNKFIIDTKMPFCALPKNIAGIIARRRVVLNDQHVGEFMEFSDSNADNYKRDTLTSSASFNKQSTGKRISKFLGGQSPRNTTKTSNPTASSQLSLFSQQPILANNSSTNPFYDHRFPVIFESISLAHKYILFYLCVFI
jgi:hypothetical protein